MSDWKAWMTLLDDILELSTAQTESLCPSCGNPTLEARFLAGADRVGWGAMWCRCCGRGVHLSRVVFPDVFETLPIGSEVEIPAFETVRPD